MEQAQPNPWEMTPEQLAPHAAPVAAPVVMPGGRPNLPSPQTAPQAARDRYQAAQGPSDVERARIEAERAAVQLEADRRALAAGPGAQAAQNERQAASFLIRAMGSNHAYELSHVGPRSVPGQALADEFPRIAYANSDPQRQVSEDTQNEFIAATLRQDSGAAIPPAEIENQRQIYFPRPGASPEAIAEARAARARAIAGLLNAGGRSVTPELRTSAEHYLEALNRYNAATVTPPPAGRPPEAPGGAAPPMGSGPGSDPPGDPNTLVVDVTGGHWPTTLAEADPEFRRAYGAALQQNPNLNFGDFVQSVRAHGNTGGNINASGAGQVGGNALDPTPSSWADEPRALLAGAANDVAGVGQGLVAIPDAATNAAGAVMSLGADTLGFHNAAESYRHPFTLGGAIEAAAPTPDSTVGRVGRFGGQLLGGGMTPTRAAQSVADRMIGAVPARLPEAALPSIPRVADDARRLNIPMLPADVGGPTTRVLTAAVAQTPGGAAPIVNAASRSVAAGAAALRGIASRAGLPVGAEQAGETATAGALAYRAASRTAVTRLYDSATRLAGDTMVRPDNAIAALDRNIAELSQNPAAVAAPDAAMSYLTSLRDTLATKFPNGVTVAGIRGMRTTLRDRFLKDGLRGSDVERRVNEVVDLASDDLATSLANAGRGEAADAYRAADAAWRARAETLDNVIMPIIGRQGEKSGEQVFQALQSASHGNGVRFGSFVRALPEEEQGTVRASIINGLGRPTAGRQNAAGDVFSLNDFLTHWNNLTGSARNVLFTGRAREDIEALARVAEQAKQAAAYANSSRTGGVIATLATGGAYAHSWEAVVAALSAQRVAGEILASPLTAGILARVGSARTVQQAQTAIGRLAVVARRNPAIANDLGELQRRLLDAFSGSPASSAAAQQNENVR